MSKLRALAVTGGVFLVGGVLVAAFPKHIKVAIDFTVGGLVYSVGYLSSLVMTRKKKEREGEKSDERGGVQSKQGTSGADLGDWKKLNVTELPADFVQKAKWSKRMKMLFKS